MVLWTLWSTRGASRLALRLSRLTHRASVRPLHNVTTQQARPSADFSRGYEKAWVTSVVGAAVCFSAGVLCSQQVATKQEGPEVFDPYFISRAAEKAAPAVVNLTWKSKESSIMGSFIPGRSGQPSSGGSGFIISKDGTIVTNAHVVESQKTKGGELTITLHDGRTFPGRVVNTDPLSDLAIVKVECKEDLPTVSLGDSTGLRIGEWVVALGSPLFLNNTITAGVISCVERKSSDLNIRGSRTDYIQTDTAINMGNSGGPLVNLKGEVIGINAMTAFAANGVSFAIPVETCKFVVQQILKYNRVVRPYIGVKMLELSQKTANMIRRENPAFPNVDSGIYVPQVTPGSPAEKAGFQHGDVITVFDGREVKKGEEIIELLGNKVGKRHQVVVLRDHGEKKVLYVTSVETIS